ncbi:hypothetical protein V8C35DRAFT_295388 [Trichoderma chlorosporum]
MSRLNNELFFSQNRRAMPTAEEGFGNADYGESPNPEPRAEQAARDRVRNSRQQTAGNSSGGDRIAGVSSSEGHTAHDPKFQLREQESLINDLLANAQKSEMEVQRLQTALEQVTRQAEMVSDLSDKLQAAEAEIRGLQTKEQALRDFMLQNAEDQGSNEQVVISRYTRLGQSIHKLAMSKTYQVERSTFFASQGSLQMDEYLGALWETSSRPTRLWILRATIFQILHSKILSHEMFDVDETGTYPVTDFARVLGQFERTIIHRGASRDAVVDWRLSTFKCIKAAGLDGKEFGVQVAQYMYDVFSPLIAVEATQEEQTKLRNMMLDLCLEASALRLLMRKSREPYECWSMARGQLKENEHLCEIFGEVAGDSTQTKSVMFFTLIGALVKYERFSNEGPKVLEKAQVIRTSN